MSLIRSMRKYWALSSLAFQDALAYRSRYIVSVSTGLIQVFIQYSIWALVYSDRYEIGSINSSQMSTYVLLSFAIRNLYSFYTETSISRGIRDGGILIDLMKPLNYQFARFFESLGAVLLEALVISILVIVIGFGLIGIVLPERLSSGLLFSISLVLSVLINFALSYIVGLCSFWTTSIVGLVNCKRYISDFFSGGLVPLALFPEWLKICASLLPFIGIVHIPLSIYLGHTTGVRAAKSIAIQFVWVLVLWILGHLLWKSASRKITISGG